MSRRPRASIGPLVLVALVFAMFGATAAPAVAHGGEGSSAEELVLTAIAVLEVHPAPGAAVDDKIRDAQEAEDQSGVKMDLVRKADATLARGDVAATRRLLEDSVGVCPDSDILYVNDQSEKPPCVAPTHALEVARRSVGGASKVLLLLAAAVFALAGVAIVRQPRLRRHQAGDKL